MKLKCFLLLVSIIVLSSFLRIFNLSKFPPSLYWDEASLGYNAYTIYTSGKDEHGEVFPLDRFIAFGDYKPPGYIYSIVPFISVLGLTEVAVRLPSAIAGIGIVLMGFCLANRLFFSKKIGLITALFIGVSPWTLQLSRGAFEANLAAFFNLCGVYFFISGRGKRGWYLLSIIAFILSFYTFNGNRIIAPLMLLLLSIFNLQELKKNWKEVVIALLVGILLLSPSFSYLQSRESKIRFQEVSIFNNLEPIEVSNAEIARENGTILAKMIHNRRVLYSLDFIKHFTDHFRAQYLFISGDVNPRLSIQEVGELYLFDIPFLLVGVYFLIATKKKDFFFLLGWVAIAILPAAVAKETPHALRTASIIPVYQLISAFGLATLFSRLDFKSINKRNITYLVVCSFIFIVCITQYLHYYYLHYPKHWDGEWQYGYKQMVQYVQNREGSYDKVYVTAKLGRPYIFFAFYNRYSVEDFLRERKADRDWFGFWTVHSIGNISFEVPDLAQVSGHVLVITTDEKYPDNFHLLKKIYNLSGTPVFFIIEKR